MSIKIGDRVKVVKNGPYDGPRYLGENGVVIGIDPQDCSMPYLLQMDADADRWWCAEVERLGPGSVPVPVVDRVYIERLGLGKQEMADLLELYEAYMALAGR